MNIDSRQSTLSQEQLQQEDHIMCEVTEKDVENRQKFLDRLRNSVTGESLFLIDFAYDLAKYGHRNQKRDSGERYFEHCRQTALILIDELCITDPEIISAALMHDMLEDNFLLSPERLQHIFGHSVADLVATVTKPKKNDVRFLTDKERHEYYFEQIRFAGNKAKLIKLADRLHNLRTMAECAPEKRARKIQETIDVYYPLMNDFNFRVAGFFRREFDKELAKLRQQ